jgi:hypothetical protein
MAKKKYRVSYGTHYMPNPEFKINPTTGSAGNDQPSHIAVQEGEIIELEEYRAEAFTKRYFGHTPKLVEVSDSAGIPEITTSDNPNSNVNPMPAPKQPPPAPPVPPAAALTPKAQVPR